MCPELLLAFLYFFTVLLVNYFLGKFLTTGWEKILFFLKLKKIAQLYKPQGTFSKSPLSLLSFFYFTPQKQNARRFLASVSNLKTTQDLLVLGNSYKYLMKIQGKTRSLTPNYYFQLLQLQYIAEFV
jgi:hypothetical protein